MRRPLPNIPRGPRRVRSAAPLPSLLGLPRVAPDYEMAALRALIKPQTGGAILHRTSRQPWPKDAERRVEEAQALVRDRLGYDPAVHFPPQGDYYMVVQVAPAEADSARAFALLLSRALPGAWLTLDRLFVRDGKFYRRRRRGGYRLQLGPANDVHLPRAIRAALRGNL